MDRFDYQPHARDRLRVAAHRDRIKLVEFFVRDRGRESVFAVQSDLEFGNPVVLVPKIRIVG